MLAKAVPGERQVIGIDLAQGMVDVANERIGDSSDPALRCTSLDWTSLTPTCRIQAVLYSSLCHLQQIRQSSGRFACKGNLRDPSSPCRQRVRACVGDACKLPNIGRSPALIFSCFGLQQMPEPQEVSQSPVVYMCLRTSALRDAPLSACTACQHDP